MKQLSRLGIQRMIDTSVSAGSGGSGGNDISIAGYATEAWVEENYLSKEFFLRLFGIHGTDENDDPVDVEPNDPDTTITDIEAMFGFWTEQYISALGQGSGGGGGGGSDTLAGLIDVELTNPVAGQVLKFNGTKWVNSAASAGTVISVGMSVPTGFAVTGSPITVSGVLGLSFADGYSLPTTAKQTNWDAAYTWTSVSRTTLADYGITDAKFGTPGTDSIPITLGSTTQSVLTQHQSLANYYTKSETDGKFLTISFFRSLFKAYTSNNTEVQPNDGSTSTIASIKAMFGFWTEQYLSALGQSSGGGGGITLKEPLLSINQAGLSAPIYNGSVLVYNGGWKYSNTANISATGISVTGTASAAGFSATGKDNTYVLLAGGGTKLLSEIGGGYTLPAATTSALGGVKVNATFGQAVTVQESGNVSSRNYGLQIDNNGKAFVYVPWEDHTYTSIPRLSQTELADNGSLSTFYTDNDLTYTAKGGSNTVSDKPSGVGAFGVLSFKTASGYHGQIMLDINANLFVRSADVLNGGWIKIASQSWVSEQGYITGITSSMVTSALGFTPAASSDLSNYVTLATQQTISGGKRFSSTTDFDSWLVIWDGSSHNKDMSFGWRGDYFNMYAYENVFYDICIGGTTADGGSLYYDASASSWGIGTGAPAYTLDVVGDVSATNFRGNLVGNADTATKLATKRKIYGNYFDGTADIVNYLTMEGWLVIWEGSSHTHDMNMGWRGDFFNMYAFEGGVFYDLCLGTTSPSSSLYFDASATRWGINTATPAYTLDVVGNAQFGADSTRKLRLGTTTNAASISMVGSDNVSRAAMNLNASNNLVIGAGFAINNNTTAVYFANGVYLEWDSTNNAVKLNGSFYATGSVSALGSSSSGTTYLDQATADGRYLKLSGGQTMTGSFSGTSITLSSQMKSTNAVATAYMTVGTSSINTSYTMYVNGTAKIKNLTITDITGTNNETRLETSNALLRLKASASVYANNTLISSDMRMKHIRSYASAGIEQIANAPVFNFVFTDAPQYVHLGTSAQYWQTIFPCAVDTMPDTYLAMDYGSIALASAVMVARKVQSHEERIAALEAENARLQKELNELKAA